MDFIPHTPTVLKQIFQKRGIKPNKRFGQNFLIDQNILLSIPVIAGLKDSDVVLEIGTGTGGLTRLLAAKSLHVFTVEVDNKLFEMSSEILRFYNNITLINADILETKHRLNREVVSTIRDWLERERHNHIKIISNLPYNISTPVIINFLESDLPIDSMVFMLQKEIAERMSAMPATREYGTLSVITQLYSDVEVVKTLPPEVFWPRPDVQSGIVKITVNKAKYANRISDYPFFRRVVHAIFTSRRKTLLNSLEQMNLPGISRERLKVVLGGLQLDERVRGEVLDLDQLIRLAEAVRNL